MTDFLMFIMYLFFMISVFLFGAMIWATYQKTRLLNIKKQIKSFDKQLAQIKISINQLLTEVMK